ncbi:conserved hypothetical protein [Trichophyton verrucosum HKI 0517]|uniref:Uncharacterized protein n=1 Tax=Trichophyton verrucosum (strain HKI 0517) TaxID=663202 RepID=D4DKR6_TRIVH|nr:uncharacterized protein TRV_07790 [Trichophyton verrucosum HKI 0517]EFE37570.1 conserved hypothetical protein [Trichophyton verrucosum HKI 0517]
MEVFHEAPNTSSFVPLAEHQSRTPASFYSGPPILHHFSERCKVVILEHDLLASPALNSLRWTTSEGSSNGTAQGERGVTAGTTVDEAAKDTKELSLPGVSVWVTSEYVSRSLGLYMQLAITSGGDENMDEDVDEDSISLTIIPLSGPATQPTDQETSAEEEDKKTQSQIEALFEAVSACSNLHPDPVDQDDEDRYEDADEGEEFHQQLQGSALFQNGLIFPGNNTGGLPPALPGSGGWITAENAHEYFDEDGNWKGGEEAPLGAGAGTVRPREDDDEGMNEAGASNNENGTSGDETKWRRTE